MVDITRMVAPKTDQLNADDFIGKKPFTVRITGVKETGNKEQPLAISFEGDQGKPWKPGLGMRRVLIQIWGDEASAEAEKHFPGRAVTLYRDPDVKFGKDTVGGIRVSHASNINSEMKCTMTVSKGKRVEFIVKPLRMEKQAPQEQAASETEKPAHVKLAAAIVRRIQGFTELAPLQEYMATEAADDLDTVQKANEETYKYIVAQYDLKKAELEIPA